MKVIIISVFAFVALVGGVFMLALRSGGTQQVTSVSANNVSILDGTQVIEIRAKGGYVPRMSEARAGVPTVLRFDANGTFDCSSVVRIPSLNISTNLSSSGLTDINLGEQAVGTLHGTCGMGMYPFEIAFKG